MALSKAIHDAKVKLPVCPIDAAACQTTCRERSSTLQRQPARLTTTITISSSSAQHHLCYQPLHFTQHEIQNGDPLKAKDVLAPPATTVCPTYVTQSALMNYSKNPIPQRLEPQPVNVAQAGLIASACSLPARNPYALRYNMHVPCLPPHFFVFPTKDQAAAKASYKPPLYPSKSLHE